jgi:hypothetical protein
LIKDHVSLLGRELGERLFVHLLDCLGRCGAEQVPITLDSNFIFRASCASSSNLIRGATILFVSAAK